VLRPADETREDLSKRSLLVSAVVRVGEHGIETASRHLEGKRGVDLTEGLDEGDGVSREVGLPGKEKQRGMNRQSRDRSKLLQRETRAHPRVLLSVSIDELLPPRWILDMLPDRVHPSL
jgi:hypothetical protein